MNIAGKFQRGFSLISAIFLLVVIAALGAFAVTLSTTQQQSAALDVLGARGYQAARAGVEWGAYQVLRNPAGISCAVGGVSNPVAMPAAPSTLAIFTVDASCWSYAPVSEAASTITMYRLVLYTLIFLLLFAATLSFLGILSFNFISLLFSAAFLVFPGSFSNFHLCRFSILGHI